VPGRDLGHGVGDRHTCRVDVTRSDDADSLDVHEVSVSDAGQYCRGSIPEFLPQVCRELFAVTGDDPKTFVLQLLDRECECPAAETVLSQSL